MEGVPDASYDELAEITLGSGERRYGRVITIEGERVILQVFGGTDGIDLAHVNTHFTGKPVRLPVQRKFWAAPSTARASPRWPAGGLSRRAAGY